MSKWLSAANCIAILSPCRRFWRTDHSQANLNGAQHVWRHTKYHSLIKYGTAICPLHARFLFRHFFIIFLQINLKRDELMYKLCIIYLLLTIRVYLNENILWRFIFIIIFVELEISCLHNNNGQTFSGW